MYSYDEMAGETDSEGEAKKKPLFKKQCKLNCLTVAELKLLIAKPEVVEWTVISATDPRLLHLKCHHNTIPIPAHWSTKRDYLQGKCGIEKTTQHDALKEKEANMSLKAKTRERVQPKMGKIDIDYQKAPRCILQISDKAGRLAHPPLCNSDAHRFFSSPPSSSPPSSAPD
jgi:splicing factor 3B subunit 2